MRYTDESNLYKKKQNSDYQGLGRREYCLMGTEFQLGMMENSGNG